MWWLSGQVTSCLEDGAGHVVRLQFVYDVFLRHQQLGVVASKRALREVQDFVVAVNENLGGTSAAVVTNMYIESLLLVSFNPT